MKRARAVIGANYGDEGKGLVTDYLAANGGDVVVRFNGGAQAGHTVVTPLGARHVFHHFGSGSFHGMPTYWSEFAIVNPFACLKELDELVSHRATYHPAMICDLYAHPNCLVTTPWDMDANQYKERERYLLKHGSCGMGIFETIKRDKKIPLRMRDLWSGDGQYLKGKLRTIRRSYGRHDEADANTEAKFLKDCDKVARLIEPANIASFSDPIFEGAQGLMIGQENMADFPYLSPSYCGMRNVRQLCYSGGFDSCDTYYVSRTYLTRHGVGPLPCEDTKMGYPDKTNVLSEWQGKVRFAPLDIKSLRERIHADCDKPKLVMTHCNERPPLTLFDDPEWWSYGETRDDFTNERKAA